MKSAVKILLLLLFILSCTWGHHTTVVHKDSLTIDSSGRYYRMQEKKTEGQANRVTYIIWMYGLLILGIIIFILRR